MGQISTTYLNKTVIQKRLEGGSENSIGEPTNTPTTIKSDLKIRITRNAPNTGVDYISDFGGQRANTEHKGFTLPTEDIVKGDILVDGSKKYLVEDVETEPGGVQNHHFELWLKKVSNG